MKTFLTCCLALILITACNSNKQKVLEEEAANPGKKIETVIADEHNEKNSLNYFGIYEGLTPCADCEGIKVKLTLNKDETFAIKSVYIKNRKEVSPTETTGKFVLNKTGNMISLQNATEFPSYFLVGEGNLTIIDKDGNKIDEKLAEHYILKQIETF